MVLEKIRKMLSRMEAESRKYETIFFFAVLQHAATTSIKFRKIFRLHQKKIIKKKAKFWSAEKKN